jgi:hypothetical protein
LSYMFRPAELEWFEVLQIATKAKGGTGKPSKLWTMPVGKAPWAYRSGRGIAASSKNEVTPILMVTSQSSMHCSAGCTVAGTRSQEPWSQVESLLPVYLHGIVTQCSRVKIFGINGLLECRGGYIRTYMYAPLRSAASISTMLYSTDCPYTGWHVGAPLHQCC